jgi:hypothetical protein
MHGGAGGEDEDGSDAKAVHAILLVLAWTATDVTGDGLCSTYLYVDVRVMPTSGAVVRL